MAEAEPKWEFGGMVFVFDVSRLKTTNQLYIGIYVTYPG